MGKRVSVEVRLMWRGENSGDSATWPVGEVVAEELPDERRAAVLGEGSDGGSLKVRLGGARLLSSRGEDGEFGGLVRSTGMIEVAGLRPLMHLSVREVAL